MSKPKISLSPVCPCQVSSKTPVLFSNCCQQYIKGSKFPDTAEQLMRSRYSAYVVEDKDYLLSSWHLSTRPDQIDFDTNSKWLGLKIISCSEGKIDDQDGWVKFIARFKIAGKAQRLEEHSYFTRVSGHWQYLSAKQSDE